MRESEGDDLTGIRRVRSDLLVAGHRRVEAHLAGRDAGSAAPWPSITVPSASTSSAVGASSTQPETARARKVAASDQRF
jgi:hypothetical protein